MTNINLLHFNVNTKSIIYCSAHTLYHKLCNATLPSEDRKGIICNQFVPLKYFNSNVEMDYK